MADKNMNLEIHHCVSGLNPSTGGPAISVTRLCDNFASAGASVAIHSLDCQPSSDGHILPANPDVCVFLTRWSSLKILRFAMGIKFEADFKKNSTSASIIHSHGIWLPFNHSVSRTAFNLKIPHIISPRGMLEPWAYNYKSLKKQIVWRLYQKSDLRRATAFCATSGMEAENIRKLGFKQPIAIIPNGADIPHIEYENCGKRCNYTVLFLSRFHPKKGVMDLIEAWKRLKETCGPQVKKWRLKLAGPDEAGYKARVSQVVGNSDQKHNVEVLGPVYGEEKNRLFQEADLFVLPTYSENFGNAIAEALAAGIPVITTKGAPWEDIELYGCGWWTDTGAEACFAALKEALLMPEEDRAAMGKNGRDLVIKEYSWRSAAIKMLAYYRWILEGGRAPECVFKD